mgnify:CR=1 FL=1
MGWLLTIEVTEKNKFHYFATYAEDIDLNFSEYGDKPIHKQSHGESFLNLVNYRFRGNGLYLLD